MGLNDSGSGGSIPSFRSNHSLTKDLLLLLLLLAHTTLLPLRCGDGKRVTTSVRTRVFKLNGVHSVQYNQTQIVTST